MTTRPRGNKTSKAAREQRRSSVVEVLKEQPTATNQDLAAQAGVSLATVKRDLADLRERFSLVTDASYEEFKKAQLAVFELIERNLVAGTVAPEVAREWRGIRSEISQLLGLNAPSRSIHANVSTSLTPDLLAILSEFSGIPQADMPRAVEAARAALRSFQQPVTLEASLEIAGLLPQ
ncbi:MAG: HTH domain-containing protein [Terriglobales bacterium]